jgi:hypothetical protein
VENVPEEVLRDEYSTALDSRQRSFFSITLEYAKGVCMEDRYGETGAPRPQNTIEEYAKRILKGANARHT